MVFWIFLVVMAGLTIVASVFIHHYFDFKKEELSYKKVEDEYAQRTLKERTALEVEQERTKQRLLDKEQEQEKTKQLEIKAQYHEKHGRHLY